MIDYPDDLPRGILPRAVSYALAWIDTLPPDRRVAGERDDLVWLLNILANDEALSARLAEEVRQRTGHLPDLTDNKGRYWRLPGPQ